MIRQTWLAAGLFSTDGHIPVPTNVEELDAGHKAQFSRQRSRDISGPLQSTGGTFGPGFMSGGDKLAADAHVGSYDCTGAVSLHSVMQTNVPEPFSPSGKAPSHLNMPGGQWSQEDKYLSQDRQDAHQANNSPVRPTKDNKGTLDCCSVRYNVCVEFSSQCRLLFTITSPSFAARKICLDRNKKSEKSIPVF